MNEYSKYEARIKARWGDKADFSGIPEAFKRFFNGDRISVRFPWGEVVRGRVSGSTGWKPCLLLMRRSNSRGSSDVINDTCEVVW